jgi:hypothetical protein
MAFVQKRYLLSEIRIGHTHHFLGTASRCQSDLLHDPLLLLYAEPLRVKFLSSAVRVSGAILLTMTD